MARAYFLILTGLVAFGTIVGGGAVFAQQRQDAQTSPPPAQTAPAPAQAAPDAAASEEDNEDNDRFPVLALTSVEILRSTHQPTLDVVVVNAVTSADGWTDGELVPLRRGGTPAADGVLDLIFEAQPPQESAAPTGYTPIQAVLPLAAGHPFKAVRVRAATNSILVQDFPGVAEGKQPAEPCQPCVGKLFVGKDGAVPSGTTAGDIVREEDLPKNTRILHPSDGVASAQPDPNRLTIVIGEDGRIADAAWE
jgi:hypothetical protein